MKILWHTWEPGLLTDEPSSGGGGAWTQYLFNQFNRRGHSIRWFTHDAAMVDEKWDIKSIDIAVFCWRWKMSDDPRYIQRNIAYERQNLLLSLCIKNRVPFIIHDQDLKVSSIERQYIIDNGGIIATPSFFPKDGEIGLHFPNPYGNRQWISKSYDENVVYIGNNYERITQFSRLLGRYSKLGRQTTVYGNWLDEGSGRESPQQIKEMFPDINFGGRLDQTKVIDVLHRAKATVLLHKNEYGDRGFVTIRWAEAAAAGTLPFIPIEFELPVEWKSILDDLRVIGGEDMAYRLSNMSQMRREFNIEQFRKLVAEYMSPQPWFNLLERLGSQ